MCIFNLKTAVHNIIISKIFSIYIYDIIHKLSGILFTRVIPNYKFIQTPPSHCSYIFNSVTHQLRLGTFKNIIRNITPPFGNTLYLLLLQLIATYGR